MQHDHRNRADVEISGVYFAVEELESLVGLSLPGVRVEIATTSSMYEELALIRLRGSPSTILGTLHKTPDGLLILTRKDASRPACPGPREAYVTVDDAVHGMSRLAAS